MLAQRAVPSVGWMYQPRFFIRSGRWNTLKSSEVNATSVMSGREITRKPGIASMPVTNRCVASRIAAATAR